MKTLIALMSLLVGASWAHAGQPLPAEFDNRGNAVYEGYAGMNDTYRSGGSSERTLQEYYSRRQYPGSPPVVPHPVEEGFNDEINCLSCHAAGGWVEDHRKHAPVTPHPEMSSCRQCHMPMGTGELFRETDWMSVPPPRLGGSALPGSPPRPASPADARKLPRLPRRPGSGDEHPVGARRAWTLPSVPPSAGSGRALPEKGALKRAIGKS